MCKGGSDFSGEEGGGGPGALRITEKAEGGQRVINAWALRPPEDTPGRHWWYLHILGICLLTVLTYLGMNLNKAQGGGEGVFEMVGQADLIPISADRIRHKLKSQKITLPQTRR